MTGVAFETSRAPDYLTRLAASDVGRSYKARALRQLAVEAGNVVVDLGCGPGVDLPALSAVTGPQGTVVGVDHEPAAVADARRRASGRSNVTVLLGDAHHLDLGTGTVDRVRTDRVLQHVLDPARVLDEVARVLRPGGRAVFAEPDWDTLVIDHPDGVLASTYRDHVVGDVVRNARIGRQLHRLTSGVGLRVDEVTAVTTVFLDATEADRVLGLRRVTDRVVAAGLWDTTDADRWLEHLGARPFLASVTLFLVSCESTAARARSS